MSVGTAGSWASQGVLEIYARLLKPLDEAGLGHVFFEGLLDASSAINRLEGLVLKVGGELASALTSSVVAAVQLLKREGRFPGLTVYEVRSAYWKA